MSLTATVPERPDPAQNALELKGVSRAFAAHLAVDDVSLTVGRGEFVTLLGPSGCGKTTILRMVAGFEEPTGGTVVVGGRSMSGVPPYRRPVGIVFQNLALFPHMTVFGNIAFGLEVARLPRKDVVSRVEEALALIGLSDLGGRGVHQISGGQRQRVALARALVTRPTVLLLDEPLGALDLKIRRQLQLELKRIQRQVGTTFVFVTHDQEEALTMSDRIAVMNCGRIEQLGTPAEIYNRPKTAFVARFIGDTNLVSGRVLRVSNGRAAIMLDGADEVVEATSTAERPMRPDGRVALAIRPENVRVAPEGFGGAAISAVLEEAVYAGAHVRYRARTSAGDFIMNVPVAPSDPSVLPLGHSVRLTWNEGDCVVQPAEA